MAEAAVRLVKRALNNLAGDGIFTWIEFQTFLFMAANLVDALIQSREDCVCYVSPNCLLLGQASPNGDPATFNYESYTYKRLQTIQAEVNKFWRKLSQMAGPNLFIQSKWHTKERNIAIGDVVWVADKRAEEPVQTWQSGQLSQLGQERSCQRCQSDSLPKFSSGHQETSQTRSQEQDPCHHPPQRYQTARCSPAH